MKSIKFLTIVALCASSMSPVMVTPAFATDPQVGTLSSMNSMCASDLQNRGINAFELLHDGTPRWSSETVITAAVDGPTTEVAGSRVETPGSRFGTGSATYSNLAISGDPFRTGGSVNMFGDQVATLKHWANSEYDFTADYETVTTYNWDCVVSETLETYIPAIPGHPVIGHYEVNPDFNGNEEAGQNSCDAFNASAPVAPLWVAPGYWGKSPHGNCVFVVDEDAYAGEPERWETGETIVRDDLSGNFTIDESNVEYDVAGHEANAGPWTESGNWFVAKVVVCISPKRLPGIWTTQNGYTGTKCNTAYFNTAPWGGGSQTSNGTYISVPGL